MKENFSYKRRNYEAIADAPQSISFLGKTSQILSTGIKG